MVDRLACVPHSLRSANGSIKCAGTLLLPFDIARVNNETVEIIGFVESSFEPLEFMNCRSPSRNKWTALGSAALFVACKFMDGDWYMLWSMKRLSCE